MAKIRLTVENLNTQPESSIYNALHQADDWCNFDELYRAANSIHIMRYMLEQGAKAYLNIVDNTEKTRITNQLTSAGYSFAYDSSNVLTSLTPPPGVQAPPDYDPFTVTITEDVVNHDDDATAISLREALTNDPNFYENNAFFDRELVVTLESPIVLDKATNIIMTNSDKSIMATINGDMSIESGTTTFRGIAFNGNITIAPDATLQLKSVSWSNAFSGSISGGTLQLSDNIALDAEISNLDKLIFNSPTVTLGENSNIDLSGTVINTYASGPTVGSSAWPTQNKCINKQGIDFSNIRGIQTYFMTSTDDGLYHVGKKYVFNQTSTPKSGKFDVPQRQVYEIKENETNIYFERVTNLQIDKDDNTEGGTVTFEDAILSGFTNITFSESLANVNTTYDDGIRAYAQGTVNGKGIENTHITGGRLYAAANKLQINDLSYKGTLFGGRNTVMGQNISGRTYYSLGTTKEDSKLILSNVLLEEGSRIYGGGNASLADKTLSHRNISVSIADTYVGQGVSIYGAGHLSAENGKIVAASITLDIESTNDDSRSGNIYAGGYTASTGGSVTISGNVSTTIRDGHFNYTGNGTRTTTGNSSEQGASTLRIEGGTFDGPVYAGGFTMGGEAVVNGSTLLEISGGTFTKEIYGGCGANKAKLGSYTLIDGSANTRIVAGEDVIHFGGCVFAGSYGAGTILGSDGVGTTLTFTGNGDVIEWDDNSKVYGCCQLSRGAITGSRELIFDAFSNAEGKSFGTLDEKNGFDTVSAINGSDVTFSRPALLSNVSNWNLEVGSTISWESGNPLAATSNDIDEDSIDISGLDDGVSDSTLLTGCTILNWENAYVSFNGGEQCRCSNGIYTDGTYRLWLDVDSVKVGMLASA